jgi:hypothetical protein
MALVLLRVASHLRQLFLVPAVREVAQNWKSAVMQMRTSGQAQDRTCAAMLLTSTTKPLATSDRAKRIFQQMFSRPTLSLVHVCTW